ncbi:MAG: PEP-CTERM sorting domain-containing protein [Gammaproteobacteria bacterium]|nr:PEP-CTERM sorting domain-containing protein [Gammaproteobacteria bacterium]
MNAKKIFISVFFIIVSSSSMANIISYEGNSPYTGNCYPFGCSSWGDFMSFTYKNIATTDLKVGDSIKFDLTNGVTTNLDIDLYLGNTTTNGATTVDSNGMIKVSNINGTYGDSITGNWDVNFVLDTAFDISGGGLIIGFGIGNDFIYAGQMGAILSTYSDSAGFFVQRSFGMDSAWEGGSSGSTSAIANFQITTSEVPEPSILALMSLGLLGMFGVNRRNVQA